MWGRARAPSLPTILLAERHDSLGEVLTRLLAEEGFYVLTADTRHAFLTQLRQAPRIDLVLADRGLRGMPAWDIVQEAAWRRPGIRCIRLVESRADALPIYGIDPSAESILQTPVTIIQLLVAIDGLLRGGEPVGAP
jgi:DNA-binding response OmpR family regulator